MKQQMICRGPLNGQDHFIIGTAYVKAEHLCRCLENCKEMYVNRLCFDPACEKEAGRIETACSSNSFECISYRKDSCPDLKLVPVPAGAFSPEELRRDVYSAVLSGAHGIVYDSILKDRPVWKNEPEPVFHFIQELNYRLTQYGRTMMALKPAGVYLSDRTSERAPSLSSLRRNLKDSAVLDVQELPDDLVIGEFSDEENNVYLMIQNLDCSIRTAKPFQFRLSREFRCYRVNPHNGKQVLVKDRTNGQSILIMPGDADLLRYQPADEEPFLIEYVFTK
ncbi:MAG: hypothetical protein IK088_01215 [Lachnospiraceae bacterium]|nr:hypothetical protein [Lachnospiraceae bacterium]